MTCIPILVFCLLHLYLSLLIKSRFKFEIETKKNKEENWPSGRPRSLGPLTHISASAQPMKTALTGGPSCQPPFCPYAYAMVN